LLYLDFIYLQYYGRLAHDSLTYNT